MVMILASHDPLSRWRRRLIRETEAALLYGLTHPSEVPRIPTIEVRRGSFTQSFGDRWWSALFSHDELLRAF